MALSDCVLHAVLAQKFLPPFPCCFPPIQTLPRTTHTRTYLPACITRCVLPSNSSNTSTNKYQATPSTIDGMYGPTDCTMTMALCNDVSHPISSSALAVLADVQHHHQRNPVQRRSPAPPTPSTYLGSSFIVYHWHWTTLSVFSSCPFASVRYSIRCPLPIKSTS